MLAAPSDGLDAAPDEFELCGYSMGARLALHVALAAPQRVRRLVLVSGTAGIEDPGERAARRAADERLAEILERGTIGAFADRWLAQSLFQDDPADVQARAREDIARNDPAGLAASLRGIGTGSMEPVWERLGELSMPVTVLAGARDERYVALGERLAAGSRDARVEIVPAAGHALVRAAPGAVAAAIARER